jgi:hypothetical protein
MADKIDTIGGGRMVGIDHRVVDPIIRAAGPMVVETAGLDLRMVDLDLRMVDLDIPVGLDLRWLERDR